MINEYRFFHRSICIVFVMDLKDGMTGEEELLNKLMNRDIYKDYIISIVGVTYLHLLLKNMIQVSILSFSNIRLLKINRETHVSLQKLLLGILNCPS
ncbi:hypothetical protein ICM_04786 [Bacillus cereus BAG1X2-3]|uniref:Uncharacterized protein n=2 Tax=Bacillus cereus TaxID=1396 RepID=A0A9X7E1U3_BACCE|nr:hypothetical protein ICC_04910 [Bacillus cereus BAG1X1-1]EOO43706.1 hypothetical protein ICI_05551 [Bacillus cereus BAG1X2-1]EOO45803.1 hypothetical protein ICK_05604 [Bacillus cereus BAG1X2-2]EOO62373.1 hypothetical protein ICM_04786 [Bacillus cereus BAG1X2-3]EOP01001.1 hypothetical protein ICO_05833 [Bacillus cereus BAG2O-1]PHA11611.1 hypothetical protein COE70_30115 [Bacillus cereus]